MNMLACNYAVVRFLPYPETEEFVCIGVVLICPKTGYFGYRVETKRRDRVTGFFPELDHEIFVKGRRIFEQQLQHVHKLLGGDEQTGQMRIPRPDINPVFAFQELVRPRESLFRFSDIGVAMAEYPATELDRLYEHYVNRQFAQREEYQEAVMTRRLLSLFRQHAVLNFRGEVLGSDNYKFRIPFVRGDIQALGEIKAIKPLNFAQNDTTRIADHALIWHKRVKLLLEQNVRPDHILLPVKKAAADKRAAVAEDFCAEFRNLGVGVVEYGKHVEIVRFAKAQ